MRMNNRKNKKDDLGRVKSAKPAKNQSKKTLLIVLVVLVTAMMITWVYSMGRKATETVDVCMTTQSIYKNQQITENMVQPYKMTKAEFDKFSIVKDGGKPTRRIILWEEKDKLLGTFAAYPLQQNNLIEYRSVYRSRIDNSDSVMYSYPGKEIVSLDIGVDALQTFKTFLQPGDRVTITAVYTDKDKVQVADGFGGMTTEQVETIRSEPVFRDITIADLLNNSGDSILDIYADYNGRSVGQQAAMDASTEFQESVIPTSLLVALTPEEKDLYYYYLSKGDIKFEMSLPQRIE